MSELAWIVAGGVAMSAIAMVGSLTLLLEKKTLDRLILPMVAFAAGSLISGAFFHLIPAALAAGQEPLSAGIAAVAGFTVFLILEQFLHWHRCRRAPDDEREPLTYLILIGDGLHNFLGGLAIASTFLIDIRLGITSWLAAAAHEVPQELGDFGVLLHGGWPKRKALVMNVLSASTFLVGGLVTWALSFRLDVGWLVPFAAGNFLYIGASDLVPEINKYEDLRSNSAYILSFLAGVGVLLVAGLALR